MINCKPQVLFYHNSLAAQPVMQTKRTALRTTQECLLFVAIFECICIGWVYGEWRPSPPRPSTRNLGGLGFPVARLHLHQPLPLRDVLGSPSCWKTSCFYTLLQHREGFQAQAL